MRMLMISGLALALASCSTVQQAGLNANIATFSVAMQQQCGALDAVISTGQALVTKPKVARALAAAKAAEVAFCAAPPKDETSAILTLGAVILSVETALRA